MSLMLLGAASLLIPSWVLAQYPDFDCKPDEFSPGYLIGGETRPKEKVPGECSEVLINDDASGELLFHFLYSEQKLAEGHKECRYMVHSPADENYFDFSLKCQSRVLSDQLKKKLEAQAAQLFQVTQVKPGPCPHYWVESLNADTRYYHRLFAEEKEEGQSQCRYLVAGLGQAPENGVKTQVVKNDEIITPPADICACPQALAGEKRKVKFSRYLRAEIRKQGTCFCHYLEPGLGPEGRARDIVVEAETK